MTSGKKLVGKLVKKCMKVEPVPNGRCSGSSGSLFRSVSSRSWSRGSSRSENRNADDDSDDDDDAAAAAPVGVPEGCLPVYVGSDMRRFVIHASFLGNPVFRELLRRSEEEYGFQTGGGLRIPCEAGDFQKLLWQMESESGNYMYR